MTKADMQAVVVNAESLFYVGKTSIANLAIDRQGARAHRAVFAPDTCRSRDRIDLIRQ